MSLVERLVAFIDSQPELSSVVVCFLALTVTLHGILVYWLKISNLAWKALDYFWYVPAVAGIVLLYYDTLEKDIIRQSERHEQMLILSAQELSRNLMFLLQDARCETLRPATKKEDPFLIGPTEPGTSQELWGFCSSVAALRRSVDHWMHSTNWPEITVTDLRQDVGVDFPTEYSLSAIVDMFDQLNLRYRDQFATEAIDTYSKQLIFGGGNSELLREMGESLDSWRQVQQESQNVRSITWASSKWYWVIAFAAAFRITKIWGEIMNERRQKEMHGVIGPGEVDQMLPVVPVNQGGGGMHEDHTEHSSKAPLLAETPELKQDPGCCSQLRAVLQRRPENG